MKKIAIIGGGIAGITAAYLFQKRYQVTLFEKKDYLGGNNRSIDLGNGIQVPLVVIIFPRKQIFSHTLRYAEQFKLGVKKQLIGHTFLKNGKIEYDSSTNPLAWMKNFRPSKIAAVAKDFLYMMTGFKGLRLGSGKKIQDLIDEKKLSKDFVRHYLVPLACLYLSMSYDEVFELPLEILADWYYKYLLNPPWASMQFSFIEGGNHQLAQAFIQRSQAKFILNSRIAKVQRQAKKVVLWNHGRQHEFDKVIFATPAKQSLSLLDKPSRLESSLLGGLEYSTVTCTLHTDPSHSYKNNISMNLIRDRKKRNTVVTTYSEDCFNYNLSNKHFVTIESLGTDTVRQKHIVHQENFVTPKATAANLEKISQLQRLHSPHSRVLFCGSYFGKYFYHEDAIASAIQIDQFDQGKQHAN